MRNASHTTKEIAKYRCKIRRQTASTHEEQRYQGLTGQDPATVSRETEEQRKARLEKNRARTAQKRKMETEEQTSRRKESDRIRAKLQRKAWTDDNKEERLELESRLNDLSKRKDVSGRWRRETITETYSRLDKDMFHKRQRRAKEKEQKKLHSEAEEQRRAEAKSITEQQERKRKHIDKLQDTEKKISELYRGFNDAKDVAGDRWCYKRLDYKEKLYALERDSIQFYQELVQLGQCDGFTVPEEMRPSFIKLPPVDMYTTKWIGTVEYEWHPQRQAWIKRRKRYRTNGVTWITGHPRSSETVMECIWLYDSDPQNGKWQEKTKRVLEPSTSGFEPKRAVTEYEWRANRFSTGGKWIPQYRRLIVSNVSLDQYAEFDWHEHPRLYGDEGGHWLRRDTMVQMKKEGDFEVFPDTNAAAPGAFDPDLFRCWPSYQRHSLPHYGYEKDLTQDF